MALSDKELFEYLAADKPLVTGFPEPYHRKVPTNPGLGDMWLDKHSPVQPCSIDLHAGGIYQYGREASKPGSCGYPLDEIALKPGEAAVIATKEELTMPQDIAAVGTPPTSLSFKGVLMVNPGHVDPGYEGRLRVIVINMGREAVTIRSDDIIITLVFSRLQVQAMRAHPGATGVTVQQNHIDSIPRDFLDVEQRAARVAGEQAKATFTHEFLEARAEVKQAKDDVTKAQSDIRYAKILGGSLAAGAVAVFTVLAAVIPHCVNRGWKDEAVALKGRMEAIEMHSSIQILEERLKRMESVLTTKPIDATTSLPAPTPNTIPTQPAQPVLPAPTQQSVPGAPSVQP
jgi:deoxycytidine triphosphate deaminase